MICSSVGIGKGVFFGICLFLFCFFSVWGTFPCYVLHFGAKTCGIGCYHSVSWFEVYLGLVQGHLRLVSGWFRVHQGWFRVGLRFIQCWFRVYLGLVQGLFKVGLGFIQDYLGLVYGWFRVIQVWFRFVSLGFIQGLVQGLFRVYLGLVQGLFRVGLGLVQGLFRVGLGFI